MPTMVDPKDFLHAFHGLDFPASRSQIVGAAKDTGGLNGDVVLILEQLPEQAVRPVQVPGHLPPARVVLVELTESAGDILVAHDGLALVPDPCEREIVDRHEGLPTRRIVAVMRVAQPGEVVGGLMDLVVGEAPVGTQRGPQELVDEALPRVVHVSEASP